MSTNEEEKFRVAVMRADEVGTAIGWAEKEGWNPGLDDAAAFYAADATGFLIGKYEGVPVATISAVKYGEAFGFIGLYIVREDFRGRGFGFKIWQAAMASLAGRNVGLDGVVAQQENYRKSGFQLHHRNIRFGGVAVRRAATARVREVVDARGMDFKMVAEYDRSFFPAERRGFLKRWIDQPHSRTLAIVEGGRMAGYGTIRACHRGYKIGPLNAEGVDVARELYPALTALVPEGAEIFVDVPEPNKAAVELAEACGMAPVFETARMYTGEFPAMPLGKIFGITTFELG